MKKVALSLLLLLPLSLFARIKFGDKHAAIKIASGAKLNVSSDVSVGGTITREDGATIEGSGALAFVDGVFSDAGTHLNMTGSYDPTSSEITLSGNENIVADYGSVLATVKVSGTGNTLKGQPTMSGPIQLLNSSAALSLGIQSEMNQHITLGGGTVTLIDDLSFTGDKFFTGPGTVNTNLRKAATGGTEFTAATDMTFADTSTLVLNASVTLTGDWICQGNVTMNGNGNSIALSSGSITVASGATLTLTDMQLKEWSAGNIVLVDNTSKLRLANVIARFTSDETYLAGTIEISGNTTFTLRSSVLDFDNDATLLLNGATLSYETTEYEFAVLNESNTTAINGGLLYDLVKGGASGSTYITASTTLTSNLNLDPSGKMTIDAENPGDIVVDHSGHDLTFSSSTSTQVEIKSDADAYLTSVVVKNFVPSAVAIESGSTLTFGDLSRVELGADQTTTFRLDFDGNVTFDGNGKSLTISPTNGIYVASNSTLTLKNMTLEGVSSTALVGAASTSKIVMENVTILLADNATFATGAIDVVRNVSITGGKRFVYTSTSPLTVKTQSALTIGRDTTYSYDPTNDATDVLRFTDSTSQMVLDNCTLEIASVGAVLTAGTLVIDSTASVNGSPGSLVLGDGTVAGNNVAVKIGSSATLNIDAGVLQVLDAV